MATADEFETTIVYYRRACTAGATTGGALPEPFGRFRDACAGLLGKATAERAALQEREDKALATVVSEHAGVLRSRAVEVSDGLAAAAAVLLPRIEAGEPLPADGLSALNACIQAAEARYGACVKSDVLPAQLLAAEPGSKLYPGLIKKVEALCSRSASEVERRETDAFRNFVLQGGAHQYFDAEHAECAACWLRTKGQLFAAYARDLSHSDHLAVHTAVKVRPDAEPLMVSSWNVLEFPHLGEAEPMTDGVNPTCCEFTNFLGYKGASERQLLMEAFSSNIVIEEHVERVLQFVQDALEVRGAVAVLLQELGPDVVERLAERCGRASWDAHFSKGSGETGKCHAGTGIISKEPFDEKTSVEVQRDRKSRPFVAARRGSTWFVSCHVPLLNAKPSKKAEKPEESTAQFAAKTLKDIWAALCGGGRAGALVAGGDWNTAVAEVREVTLADLPAGCSGIECYDPGLETGLTPYLRGNPSCAIDGLICMRGV